MTASLVTDSPRGDDAGLPDVGPDASEDPTYVLGRSDAETRRLMLQSALYGDVMQRFFREAGLCHGMTVLDIGSGAGDVAFTVADIVGPTGRVVGIDTNPVVVATAQRRAEAERRTTVTFVEGDCRTTDLARDFDAVVGRFVLMYTGDVSGTLQAVVDRVRPGGVVAFAEADFTSVLGYTQAGPSNLVRTTWQWATQAFEAAGVHTAMAQPLYHAFTAAGLGEPRMALQAPLGCHAEWAGYAWLAESLRSVLPRMEQYGIVTAQELEVETLADRYRAEVVRTGFPFMMLPMITAWARKPNAQGRVQPMPDQRPSPIPDTAGFPQVAIPFCVLPFGAIWSNEGKDWCAGNADCPFECSQYWSSLLKKAGVHSTQGPAVGFLPKNGQVSAVKSTVLGS